MRRTLIGALLLALSPLAALPLAPRVDLTVLDGKATPPAVTLDAKGAAPGNLSVAVRTEDRGVAVHHVTVTDLSHQTRWLELVLTGTVAEAAQFFPGAEARPFGDQPYATPEYQQPMPLAALWTAKGGLALGLEPHERVSYVAQAARREGERGVAEVHVRVVVDPDGHRDLTFFSTPVGPEAWREALERFYDLAPDIYDLRTDVDPRVNLASAMYSAWQPEPGPGWAELCRRNRAGWDWCYAPFKRTGDIVGRPEFWNYTPARPDYKRGMPFDTLEGFHAWRKQQFSRGEHGGVAMLCYVPAMVWCEERLANERFADSLTKDPNTVCDYHTPWVTGWDNELRVLPWNTSYGEQSQRDAKDLAEELGLTGYAFDTAEGVSRYFGPHVKEFPERAWDPKLGEYVREGIATTNLMKLIHQLRTPQQKSVAVVSNLDRPYYLVVQQSDAGLHEANPWAGGRGSGDFQRWAMGRKPIVWWQGYDMPQLIAYERMSPAQVAEAYVGLADFVMLESFRIGYLPTVDFTRGVQGAVDALPALIDCVHAGWHPLTGATAHGAGFVTRYGRDAATRLAVGNETHQPLNAVVTVDNRVLGGGTQVFGLDDGALRNRFAGGNTIVEGLTVPSHKVGVARAWAKFTPALTAGTATAELTDDLGTATLRLRFGQPFAKPVTIALSRPAQATQVASVSVDGKPAALNRDGLLPVPAGRREIVVTFRTPTPYPTRKELESFPFAEGDRPATIVLRSGCTPDERRAAETLALYFRYYYAGAPDTPRVVNLPIVEADAATTNGPVVALALGQPSVRRVDRATGPLLTVTAETPAACLETVRGLLDQLDRKYRYPGPLPWRYHTNHVGIVGQWIEADGTLHGQAPKL